MSYRTKKVVFQVGLSSEYILLYTFPISDSCQLDKVLQHITSPLGKEMTIVLNNTLSLNYSIALEKRSVETIDHFEPLYYTGDHWCFTTVQLKRELTCPAVRIDSSELGTNLTILRSAAQVVNGHTNSTLVDICWDDYRRMLITSSGCGQQISWSVGLYVFGFVCFFLSLNTTTFKVGSLA